MVLQTSRERDTRLTQVTLQPEKHFDGGCLAMSQRVSCTFPILPLPSESFTIFGEPMVLFIARKGLAHDCSGSYMGLFMAGTFGYCSPSRIEISIMLNEINDE